MEELLIGTLLPGAVPIQYENVNPVWRGHVRMDQFRRQMYVKLVDPRTLAVEVICAVVGRALGLPMPRPAIVQVLPNTLPGQAQRTLFFGSEAVDNPDLKQFMKLGNSDEMFQHLKRWSKLLDAGCFDEWTGNDDRHGGNLLWGGGTNFSLIDHSHAMPWTLGSSDAAPANILLSYAADGLDRQGIEHLYTSAKTSSHPFAGVGIHQQVLDTLSAITDQSTVDGLVTFLKQRIHCLMLLISQRIGYAQASMVLRP